jgi:hypothetical protein
MQRDPGPAPEAKSSNAQVSIVANSGVHFLRRLVLGADPGNTPRLNLTAWNIGPRVTISALDASVTNSITILLVKDQMLDLAHVYFEKVDPCYGFIEREVIFQEIGNRWARPYHCGPADAVLCGVAALGSYFSKLKAVPVEGNIVTGQVAS